MMAQRVAWSTKHVDAFVADRNSVDGSLVAVPRPLGTIA